MKVPGLVRLDRLVQRVCGGFTALIVFHCEHVDGTAAGHAVGRRCRIAGAGDLGHHRFQRADDALTASITAIIPAKMAVARAVRVASHRTIGMATRLEQLVQPPSMSFAAGTEATDEPKTRGGDTV